MNIAQKEDSPYRRSRRYLYKLLHTTTIHSPLAFTIRIVITSLILLSMLAVMLETVEDIEFLYREWFYFFEILTVSIFSMEYLLRIWSAVEIPKYHHPVLGRIKYLLSPLALIDLIAIAPFYLPYITQLDLRFMRGLRLIRLLRILKLGPYSRSLTLIAQVARSKRHEIATTIFLMALVLVMSSSIMYYLEHDAQPKAFSSIPASLWWGIATLTTVGYGDVYPVTILGKLCSAMIIVIGIGIVALPSGIIVAGFIEELQHSKKIICPHCSKEIVQT